MLPKLFRDALNGIRQFFTTQRVVAIFVFLLLIWLLNQYSNSKTVIQDRMEDGTPDEEVDPSLKNKEAATNGSCTTASGSGYTTQEVANPSDLLPTDENNQWSALNPNASATKPGETAMPDLLKAGHHIGLDTIGQTLRNPNLQLRSDPIISKAEVGPWNQSTIETDYARVPLELGPCK